MDSPFSFLVNIYIASGSIFEVFVQGYGQKGSAYLDEAMALALLSIPCPGYYAKQLPSKSSLCDRLSGDIFGFKKGRMDPGPNERIRTFDFHTMGLLLNGSFILEHLSRQRIASISRIYKMHFSMGTHM